MMRTAPPCPQTPQEGGVGGTQRGAGLDRKYLSVPPKDLLSESVPPVIRQVRWRNQSLPLHYV